VVTRRAYRVAPGVLGRRGTLAHVLCPPVTRLLDGPATRLREAAATSVRSLLTDPSNPTPEDYARPAGAPGLFAADSPVWAVHGDLSMFVGGIRALFVQTLHPLAMAGVEEHSDYRRDPLGRLARTGAFIGMTTFGSEEQARAAIARVRAVHHHVVGTAPDGRPYRADDPELLTWVHAAEVGSFLEAYQRYGAGRLTDAEADRYLDEVAVVAELLGARDVPRSRAQLRGYFRYMRPELGAGRQARRAARWLVAPPLPLAARPPYALLLSAAIGMLPGRVRRDLRLIQPPLLDPFVVRPATSTLLGALGWALAPNPSVEAATRRVGAAPAA
jgi:uncharacterized protein (DUF2236 family)